MVGSLRIDCLGKDNSEIPVYGVGEGEENLWKDGAIASHNGFANKRRLPETGGALGVADVGI